MGGTIDDKTLLGADTALQTGLKGGAICFVLLGCSCDLFEGH